MRKGGDIEGRRHQQNARSFPLRMGQKILRHEKERFELIQESLFAVGGKIVGVYCRGHEFFNGLPPMKLALHIRVHFEGSHLFSAAVC